MRQAVVNPVLLTRQLQGWRASNDDAAYRSLAEALKLLVLDGRLALNARLPGERRLAEALGVSRITVSAALDRLRAEGFVISRVGSGSFTALPPGPATRPDPLHQLEPSGLIDMATAVAPAGAEVHAAYAQALASLPAHLPGHGYGPVGVDSLRRAIAGAYDSMGLATPADAIVVTAGAQNAFALLLRALCRPGDAVVIDHPSFHHAIDAITRAGLKHLPVPLAADGWDIDALTATIKRARPRLIYLIGAHHNPTGRVMTADQEAAVADAAHRAGSVLVFDDTLRELWFDTPPPAPKALGPHVVRLGSTSKAWWGGLRIGWIRAGDEVIDAVVRSRASMDLGVPIIEQLAAAILIAGDPAPLIERRRRIAAQEACLRRSLSEALPDWRVERPPGGLSLWVALPRPVSERLALSSVRHRVRIAPGTRFGVGGEFRRFIRLPFTLPEAELERAVDGLAAAWRGMDGQGRTRAVGFVSDPSVL
ncbi:PLP-dependent aminotransferase family protein [Brevundimonas sp.]|uniref:MocR-like transcription factor YczR n=1 Tax=Brevundimonas sp. TaxID=1871086 RepID=UPI002D61F7C7|nr:PLP-dependent aminotransferase family protein [Brevundimonas sp.]HYC96785.1 PLP-dependent aminotransferase family protein [Brevundimonas sp.]